MNSTRLGRELQTTCLHCQSTFRISQQQLDMARGKVVCGQCGQIFNAVLKLHSEDSGEMATIKPVNKPENSGMPVAAISKVRAKTPERPKPQAEQIRQQAPEAPPTQDPSDSDQDWSLQQALHASRSSKGSSLSGTNSLLLVILMLLLLIQSGWYFRDWLLQQPESRELLSSACSMLGCSLKPLQDLSQIQISDRNVFSHPNQQHALMVTASLSNAANFAQPWPDLWLRMSNLQGKVVAERRFKPAEYLGNEPETVDMPRDQAFGIALQLVDPGQNALNYEFLLLEPAS